MNIPVTPVVEVVRSDDPAAAVGGVTLRIARGAPCAAILLAWTPANPLRSAVHALPWPSRSET